MLSKNVIYYGRDEELAEPVTLRAGPLDLLYEQGDLRRIRLGDVEILRRVYVAVRDRNWGTVPAALTGVQIQARHDSFEIRYQAQHRQEEISFDWQGLILGDANGTIQFSMDGAARSTFWRNRIGFCILFPASLAGKACVIQQAGGAQETAAFPVDISPEQPVQPFLNMQSTAYEIIPGVWADIRFSGDLFEMEDQRNWTDASYKVFSTPLRLPYPVEISAGTRVQQFIMLHLRERAPGTLAVQAASAAQPHSIARIDVNRNMPALPLPVVGLGMASHRQELSGKEISRLRALHPGYLRVDLTLDAPGCLNRLSQAARQAGQLGCGLQIALLIPDQPEPALRAVRQELEALRPPVSAWLCFPRVEIFQGGSPVAQAVRAARGALSSYDPAIPFISGTNTDFIFLQRSLPPLKEVDGLAFAICPQVHAFDHASLVETLAVQGDTVRSAARLGNGLPVLAGPVTLKMRFNPYAAGPVAAAPPGELPAQVDARQMSLFGAAWTAGSYKYLAEAGAAQITYYETTGWRGVMETEIGSPQPEKFQSLPGSVFPLYHVLADIGDFAGGSLLPVRSTQPLQVEGFLLRKGTRERLVLASFAAHPLPVQVTGFPAPVTRRAMVDETTVLEAMQNPEGFRSTQDLPELVQDRNIDLVLPPYACLRLDRAAPGEEG